MEKVGGEWMMVARDGCSLVMLMLLLDAQGFRLMYVIYEL